jgi:hypothetical protein
VTVLVGFGCLPFLGFGSCTVNVATHLPAFRVRNLDPTVVQIFLDDAETFTETEALGDTIFTPTCRARALGSNVLFLENVGTDTLTAGGWLCTTGTAVQFAKKATPPGTLGV